MYQEGSPSRWVTLQGCCPIFSWKARFLTTTLYNLHFDNKAAHTCGCNTSLRNWLHTRFWGRLGLLGLTRIAPNPKIDFRNPIIAIIDFRMLIFGMFADPVSETLSFRIRGRKKKSMIDSDCSDCFPTPPPFRLCSQTYPPAPLLPPPFPRRWGGFSLFLVVLAVCKTTKKTNNSIFFSWDNFCQKEVFWGTNFRNFLVK